MAACGEHNNLIYPESGISLFCKNEAEAQYLDILIFDSSILVNAGAGYTLLMKKVSLDGKLVKYEDTYIKTSALWKKNDDWSYFYISTSTQELYKNEIKCTVLQKYDKKQANIIYNDIPCIKEKCV